MIHTRSSDQPNATNQDFMLAPTDIDTCAEIVIEKDGPELSKIGDPVTFKYTVTNPSAVPLENVVVRDDNGTLLDPSDDFTPTFTGGDTNGNGVLDPDEVWTYTATVTIPATASDPY